MTHVPNGTYKRQPLRWAPPGERWRWSVERFHGTRAERVQHAVVALAVRPMIDAALRCVFDVRALNGPPPARSIVVSRHVSYWDPVLMALCDLRIKPLGNAHWFRQGVVSWYARHARALPNDTAGLLRARRHLRSGGVVWMAPAGYTAVEHQPPRHGAWRLARLADAALVPAIIRGTEAFPKLDLPRKPRQLIEIEYGQPRRLPPGPTHASHTIWMDVLGDAGIEA